MKRSRKPLQAKTTDPRRLAAEKSYTRRMRREFAVLCDLAALCSGVTLSVASDAVQKRIDTAIDEEHRRAFLRTCETIGLNDHRRCAFAERLADVKARHQVGAAETTRKLLTRSKMIAVTAITAARTAGALDALDVHRSLRTLGKQKKKKKRLVKEWAALGDAKTCEECDALDGSVTTAYRDFSLNEDEEPHAADYHGDGIGGPPLHVNCRCELIISRQ